MWRHDKRCAAFWSVILCHFCWEQSCPGKNFHILVATGILEVRRPAFSPDLLIRLEWAKVIPRCLSSFSGGVPRVIYIFRGSSMHRVSRWWWPMATYFAAHTCYTWHTTLPHTLARHSRARCMMPRWWLWGCRLGAKSECPHRWSAMATFSCHSKAVACYGSRHVWRWLS